MDPDILRLVLLVLGILVVLGIYFWGRTLGQGTRGSAHDRDHLKPENEPALGSLSAKDMETIRPEPATERMDRELRQLGGILAQESDRGEGGRAGRARAEGATGNPGEQRDLFGFPADQALRPGATAGRSALPIKILQINVLARKGDPFRGDDIARAAGETDLRPGPMQIFHRFAGRSGQRALFSMASLLEPGTFPLDDMKGFSTPGLVLFAQLPGAVDGLRVYSDMLVAARRLAARLGGELQDETHSALTGQTIEHTREEILEHSRQLALARKKA